MTKRTRRARPALESDGAAQFDALITELKLDEVVVAAALKMSKGGVNNIRRQLSSPDYMRRAAINKWSTRLGQPIAISAWENRTERQYIASITDPSLAPTGT